MKDEQRLPKLTRNDTPCKGCEERFTACSDRCPKDLRGEYGYEEKVPGWAGFSMGDAEREAIDQLMKDDPDYQRERAQLEKELQAFGRKDVG